MFSISGMSARADDYLIQPDPRDLRLTARVPRDVITGGAPLRSMTNRPTRA